MFSFSPSPTYSIPTPATLSSTFPAHPLSLSPPVPGSATFPAHPRPLLPPGLAFSPIPVFFPLLSFFNFPLNPYRPDFLPHYRIFSLLPFFLFSFLRYPDFPLSPRFLDFPRTLFTCRCALQLSLPPLSFPVAARFRLYPRFFSLLSDFLIFTTARIFPFSIRLRFCTNKKQCKNSHVKD